ncbi:MAG: hypothetical protein HYY22_04300 [Thaumarchaeota archaeon]|nr:hypothetical protein [Nitrososphaerota archaeon]
MVRNVVAVVVVALVAAVAIAAVAMLLYPTFSHDAGVEVSNITSVEISLTQYGGLMPMDMARQDTHIFTNGTVTVVWRSIYGGITKAYIQNLSRSDIEDMTRRLVANKVYELSESYTTPAGVQVADAGIANITVSIDGMVKKSVINPNVADYLPPNLQRILADIKNTSQKVVNQGYVVPSKDICRYFDCGSLETHPAARTAKEFIMNAPTFKFDGIRQTVNVTYIAEATVPMDAPIHAVVTITFESKHAGYGNRSGQALAETITPHTAVINVVGDEVTSAVLDSRWDELRQKPVTTGEQTGIVSGKVSIGPLCPVEPCPGPVPDVYSSRYVVLQPEGGEPTRVKLSSDGGFEAQVRPGTYKVDLTDCTFMGCSRVLPKTVTVKANEAAYIQIDIDTGIR